MIIELEINGARVIVSGENLAVSVTEYGGEKFSGESRERQSPGCLDSKPEAPPMDGARKGPSETAAQISPSAATPAEAVADQPQAPQANATATVSNSSATSSRQTDKAGAEPPPSAPVTHSDPLDPGPIPAFLRRTA